MSCRDTIEGVFSEEVKFCGRCARWDRETTRGLCRLTNEGTGLFYKCEHFSKDTLGCPIFNRDCFYLLPSHFCGKIKLHLLDLEHLIVDANVLQEICSSPSTPTPT